MSSGPDKSGSLLPDNLVQQLEGIDTKPAQVVSILRTVRNLSENHQSAPLWAIKVVKELSQGIATSLGAECYYATQTKQVVQFLIRGESVNHEWEVELNYHLDKSGSWVECITVDQVSHRVELTNPDMVTEIIEYIKLVYNMIPKPEAVKFLARKKRRNIPFAIRCCAYILIAILSVIVKTLAERAHGTWHSTSWVPLVIFIIVLATGVMDLVLTLKPWNEGYRRH
jgi:hypothetical protein